MIPKELIKALRTIEIHTSRLANEQLAGTYTSVFKGQGLAFREVRAVPARRRRALHRLERLRAHERDLRQGVRRRARDDGDARRRSVGERAFRHQKGQQGARGRRGRGALAFSAIKNNDRVGLILGTDHIEKIVPPKKGDKHVMRVVREILGFRAGAHGHQFAPLAGDAVQGGAPAQRGLRDQRFFRARLRARAGARGRQARRHPGDARRSARRELPDVGLATFEDLETGEALLVDTGDKRVRAHYEKTMKRLSRRAVDASSASSRSTSAWCGPIARSWSRSASFFSAEPSACGRGSTMRDIVSPPRLHASRC